MGSQRASWTAEPAASDQIVAQVASYDLVAGRGGRFIVGVLAADRSRLVSFGTVELGFSYLGTAERRLEPPAPGPTASASFLPIPGQRLDPAAPGPRLVEASEATGVYGAADVRFERAGFWEGEVAATIAGERHTATAVFEVLERSAIPAVGDPAPRTENPLAGDPAVPAKAVESRAGSDEPVPDPELHSTTVAAAIAANRPVMVVVSTPPTARAGSAGPSPTACRPRRADHPPLGHRRRARGRGWRRARLSRSDGIVATGGVASREALDEWLAPPGPGQPVDPCP